MSELENILGVATDYAEENGIGSIVYFQLAHRFKESAAEWTLIGGREKTMEAAEVAYRRRGYQIPNDPHEWRIFKCQCFAAKTVEYQAPNAKTIS